MHLFNILLPSVCSFVFVFFFFFIYGEEWEALKHQEMPSAAIHSSRARCATTTAYLTGGTGIISSVPDCFSETFSWEGWGLFWPIKLQGGKSHWRGSREPSQHNRHAARQMLPVQHASILEAPLNAPTSQRRSSKRARSRLVWRKPSRPQGEKHRGRLMQPTLGTLPQHVQQGQEQLT